MTEKMKIIIGPGWEDCGWWFMNHIGETIKVRKAPFQATKGGTVNTCNCEECTEQREGKHLYTVYEVQDEHHWGSIIPAECLKEVNHE